MYQRHTFMAANAEHLVVAMQDFSSNIPFVFAAENPY